MSPAARATLATLAAVIGVLAAGWGISQWFRTPLVDEPPRSVTLSPPAPPDLPHPIRRPPPPQDYVGSAVCIQCHAEICRLYETHPMGRSLARVGEESPVEDYVEQTTFEGPPAARMKLNWLYSVERGADGVRHRETVRDHDGRIVYDQAEPVDYVVGSGQRGRSYLTNRSGLLFMSPITWYSEKRRWNLSPGYLSANLRFERRIVDGCVSCHASRMATVPDQPDRYQVNPFLEEAIGCERCHGPARRHVEFRLNGAQEDASDPILSISSLDRDRRESICFQCHLVGEARIARYGCSEFDFRPGDELSDIWTVFVRGTGVGSDSKTVAVSQPEQMLASACYRHSDGKLGCTSCHDPHSAPTPDRHDEYYRAKCLRCHDSGGTPCSLPVSQRESEADSCIRCHMPKIGASNVPHTSQTDHRILRSGRSGTEAEDGGHQPFLMVFRELENPVPQLDLERARGLLLVIEAERRKEAFLAHEAIPKLRSWCAATPDDPPAWEALGMAYWLNHEIELAQSTWETASARFPESENILKRLLVLYHETGELERGVDCATRLVGLNSWQHEYFGRLAHMLGQLQRYDEAIAAANRALEINPAVPEIHGWLADVYSMQGRNELSQHHRELFKKLTARR